MKEGKKQMNEFDRCGIETRLALAHVNAYVRGSQGNRTPFEVFEFLYGTAAKLHIARIDPKE